MNISSTPNRVSLDYTPADVAATGAATAGRSTATLSLVLGGSSRIEVLGNNGMPVLPQPAAGEDLPQALLAAAQQLEQDLAGLGLSPTYQDLRQLAASFARLTGPGGQPPTQAALASALAVIETKAGSLEQTLRAVIENSTYPNFNDFLKELAEIAQKLREQAGLVKQQAIEGRYQLRLEAVKQMRTAAEENFAARKAEIEADVNAAWGNLAGALTGAVVGGIVGGMGGGVQMFSAVSQTIGTVANSSTTINSESKKMAGNNAKLRADLADASKAEYDAAAEMKEGEISGADDLRDIGKNLRDAMAKLRQDLISAQSQSISSASAV